MNLVPFCMRCRTCGEREADKLVVLTDLTIEEMKELNLPEEAFNCDVYCTVCKSAYAV